MAPTISALARSLNALSVVRRPRRAAQMARDALALFAPYWVRITLSIFGRGFFMRPRCVFAGMISLATTPTLWNHGIVPRVAKRKMMRGMLSTVFMFHDAIVGVHMVRMMRIARGRRRVAMMRFHLSVPFDTARIA